MGKCYAADIQAEDFAPTSLRGVILIPKEWRRRAGAAQYVECIVVAVQITTQGP